MGRDDFDFAGGWTLTAEELADSQAFAHAPLNPRGSYQTHALADGRVVDVVPLLFGRAKVTLSRHAADLGYLDDF